MSTSYLWGMGYTRGKLPADLTRTLTAELSPGERLLYAAKPDWRAGVIANMAIFLFGLFWSSIAFTFFGISAASLLGLHTLTSDGKPSGLGLQIFLFVFSLPFVAIGLSCLAAPFVGVFQSLRTVHALTDQRLINLITGKFKSVQSLKLETINFIRRRDGRDGRGTLSIGYGVEKDSDGDPRPLTTEWPGVPDVKRVEALIREHAKWAR